MLQDLRYAVRLLRRTPGLTAIALLSIAISVGATSVVFAAGKSVLIDPLPYSKPEELVQIRTEWRAGDSHGDWVSWRDMQDVTARNRTLQSIGIYHYWLFNLAGDSGALPEALYGLNVSASLFPTFGVAPMLGRDILPERCPSGSGWRGTEPSYRQ